MSGRARGFAVRLGIALSVVLGTFMAAGPSASAEGPAVLFVGFVSADSDGSLPVRIRAVGRSGAGCGTADVEISGEGVGFYVIEVVSGAAKSGCPRVGDPIHFFLLYGSVDDGVPATAVGDISFSPGGHTAYLFPPLADESNIGGWTGTPPPSGGLALLTWGGPANTPVAQAVQTLGVEVAGAWHLPPGSRRYLSYLPGGPAFTQTYTTVQTGDIVTVRAR